MLLFKSKGAKRFIASVLSALNPLVSAIPGLEFITPYLDQIGGFFGLTGVGHAAKAGTVNKHKITSIASALAVLLVVADNYAPLAAYTDILRLLTSTIGAYGAGTTIGAKK